MNPLALIALYAALWIGFHFGAGYVAHHLPLSLLARLPLVSVIYAWEADGRLYERLAIRRWKDHLPEAGGFYRGGFAKRRLETQDGGYLARFALETSRAECSHWLTWLLALSFFAWNPWPIGLIMLLYGAIVNLPCILVQRYNRARFRRILNKGARASRGRTAPAARAGC